MTYSFTSILQVLVATSDCSVLVVSESGSDGNSIEDQLLQQKIPSPITKISVAPNAKFLACYRKDGVLTVMSSAFNTKVSIMSHLIRSNILIMCPLCDLLMLIAVTCVEMLSIIYLWIAAIARVTDIFWVGA